MNRPAYGLPELLLVAMAAFSAPALADCTQVSVPSMNFGTYSALDSAPLDSSTSVSITCTGTGLFGSTNVTVSLSTGASGSFSNRTLVSGSQRLLYNAYIDAARSTIFGDGNGSSSTVGVAAGRGALSSTTATVMIYGRIFANQDVAPGAYADTLTVTISY